MRKVPVCHVLYCAELYSLHFDAVKIRYLYQKHSCCMHDDNYIFHIVVAQRKRVLHFFAQQIFLLSIKVALNLWYESAGHMMSFVMFHNDAKTVVHNQLTCDLWSWHHLADVMHHVCRLLAFPRSSIYNLLVTHWWQHDCGGWRVALTGLCVILLLPWWWRKLRNGREFLGPYAFHQSHNEGFVCWFLA